MRIPDICSRFLVLLLLVKIRQLAGWTHTSDTWTHSRADPAKLLVDCGMFITCGMDIGCFDDTADMCAFLHGSCLAYQKFT